MPRSSSPARVLALAVCVAAAGVGRPLAAQYTFAAVARSGDGFDPFGFGRPALNDAGSVAFTATNADGVTFVLRYDGGVLTPIASTAATYSRFGDVSINGAGQVGFEGSFSDVRGEGIFRGDGTSVVTIAATRAAGTFDFVNAGPSLNAAGRVAFIGETEVTFLAGVYAGDGTAPATAIYDATGPATSFSANPSLNDAGFVAFVGSLASGPFGILLGDGGPLTTIASTEDGTFGFFNQPSLNDLNQVAFNAFTNAGGAGIFLGSGGSVTPIIAGSFSDFADFGSDPSLNNLGQVAYTVDFTFGNQALAIGGDPIAGRVVGSGDLLFGATVTNVVLWREGLNDRGQVAFTAFFDDGSAGVFVATPTAVPEPGTVVLLATGLVLVAAGIRRTRRSGAARQT